MKSGLAYVSIRANHTYSHYCETIEYMAPWKEENKQGNIRNPRSILKQLRGKKGTTIEWRGYKETNNHAKPLQS